MKISVEKQGVLHWHFEAHGPLHRPMRRGGLLIFASGQTTKVADGFAFTRWGAVRFARKALAFYCVPPKVEEIEV